MHVKSDAMWVETKSERSSELVATEGDVTRLRLIVEGERAFDLQGGGRFTPTGQVGVRHDGGDAETGMGLEAGAGMRYTRGALTIEGQVRTLVAHEASGVPRMGYERRHPRQPKPERAWAHLRVEAGVGPHGKRCRAALGGPGCG